jgi:hypothetical protein
MSENLKAPLPPLDLLQRYSIDEAVRYLRTSREKVYFLINHGKLRVISEAGIVGRGRKYIPGSEIARLSAAPAESEAVS